MKRVLAGLVIGLGSMGAVGCFAFLLVLVKAFAWGIVGDSLYDDFSQVKFFLIVFMYCIWFTPFSLAMPWACRVWKEPREPSDKRRLSERADDMFR